LTYNERGQPEGRRIVFWFSDDARRLPVRLRVDGVGVLNLALREASPPRTGGGASSPARSSNPRH
jgi:hypothetical protein